MALHADPVLQMSLVPKRRYSPNDAADQRIGTVVLINLVDQISSFETYSGSPLQTLPKTSAV